MSLSIEYLEFRRDSLVIFDNRLNAMGYGEQRAGTEVSLEGILDEKIRVAINLSRGFVEEENPRLAQQRPCQADKLPLSYTGEFRIIKKT